MLNGDLLFHTASPSYKKTLWFGNGVSRLALKWNSGGGKGSGVAASLLQLPLHFLPLMSLSSFSIRWCGPCKILGPRLEKMVAKQEGKVLMAKVDIDDHTDLAIEYEVGTGRAWAFLCQRRKKAHPWGRVCTQGKQRCWGGEA